MNRKFKLLYALLKNRHFRSSFLKYFAGAVAPVLVAFAAYGAVSYNLYAMYLRDALSQYQEHSLYKTSGFVDYVFNGVNQVFYLIENAPNFEKLLNAPVSALPDSHAQPATEANPESGNRLLRSDVTRVIDDLFKGTVLSPAMDSSYVYCAKNGYVLSWTDFRPLHSFFDASFMDVYRQNHTFAVREIKTGADTSQVITLIREIGETDDPLGVAAFNINYELFASYVNQEFEQSPETVCMADASGRVFYATDPSLLNTNIQEHALYGGAFAGASQSASTASYADGVVITSTWSAGGDYWVVSAVDAADIAAFQGDFLAFALWSSVIGLLAAFVLAFVISLQTYQSTIRFFSYIGGSGKPKGEDEGHYIAESIAGMTTHSRHIEHELAEKLTELKKAQAIALQNQINPHFILNTLQIANLDILNQMKRDTNAIRVISLLSEILKSNLNTTDYIVPLSYELRQAAKYMEIEHIRNNELFRVDWDIDEALTEYRTVKFVIQPVLENCFKHGLTGDTGDEKIVSLEARVEDKALLILIRDNGAGIAADTLEALQGRLKQSHIQENSHIGLCNVDRRIKLVFGEGYGVSVESAPGEGTLVVIRQKLIHKDWN
ncbi:MAG: histidine kinase [Oscillospiraceae bacterium]|nr:histidine kinase [Oscillospiraceae bacterium]